MSKQAAFRGSTQRSWCDLNASETSGSNHADESVSAAAPVVVVVVVRSWCVHSLEVSRLFVCRRCVAGLCCGRRWRGPRSTLGNLTTCLPLRRRGPCRPKRLVVVSQAGSQMRGHPAAGSRRRTLSYRFTSIFIECRGVAIPPATSHRNSASAGAPLQVLLVTTLG